MLRPTPPALLIWRTANCMPSRRSLPAEGIPGGDNGPRPPMRRVLQDRLTNEGGYSPLDGYSVRSLSHKSHSPTHLRLHLGNILVSGSTRFVKMALAVGHDEMQPPDQ